MEMLFSRAASTVLMNIAIDGLDDLDALQVFWITCFTSHTQFSILHTSLV